jgi:hypothetical protein
MDMELQKLLRAISKYPHKPMPTKPFVTFAEKLEKIRENAVFGCYPVDIPQIFQTRRGNGHIKVFRNASDIDSSDDNDKPAAKQPKVPKQKKRNKGKAGDNSDDSSTSNSSKTMNNKQRKNKSNNKNRNNRNNKGGNNRKLNKNWKLPAHIRVKISFLKTKMGVRFRIAPVWKMAPNYACCTIVSGAVIWVGVAAFFTTIHGRLD